MRFGNTVFVIAVIMIKNFFGIGDGATLVSAAMPPYVVTVYHLTLRESGFVIDVIFVVNAAQKFLKIHLLKFARIDYAKNATIAI